MRPETGAHVFPTVVVIAEAGSETAVVVSGAVVVAIVVVVVVLLVAVIDVAVVDTVSLV
jgi:hypothetical protein